MTFIFRNPDLLVKAVASGAEGLEELVNTASIIGFVDEIKKKYEKKCSDCGGIFYSDSEKIELCSGCHCVERDGEECDLCPGYEPE